MSEQSKKEENSEIFKNIMKNLKPSGVLNIKDGSDTTWLNGPDSKRMKALLNDGITWKGAAPVPGPSPYNYKTSLNGCIFKNELDNKVDGMDYVFVSNQGFVLQGPELTFSHKPEEVEDFNPNLSVNEFEPKYGYYEVIKLKAYVFPSEDNPYYGFYKNADVATLSRFIVY